MFKEKLLPIPWALSQRMSTRQLSFLEMFYRTPSLTKPKSKLRKKQSTTMLSTLKMINKLLSLNQFTSLHTETTTLYYFQNAILIPPNNVLFFTIRANLLMVLEKILATSLKKMSWITLKLTTSELTLLLLLLVMSTQRSSLRLLTRLSPLSPKRMSPSLFLTLRSPISLHLM